jgi:LmbE family N-acetylglucosaminyl deacetylase
MAVVLAYTTSARVARGARVMVGPAMGAFAQGVRLRFGVEGRRTVIEPSALAPLGRALLVFAHMDDEINAVGLISRLCAAGVTVDCLVLTDGAANPWTDQAVVGARTHFQCRSDELGEVARLLGLSALLLPGLPDSRLKEHLSSAVDLTRAAIERLKPGLIITFDPKGVNAHPDHIAAHQAVRGALATSSHRCALAMLLPPPPFSWALGAGFRSGFMPTVATLSLTGDELEQKARVFDTYRSQRRTLKLLTGGLAPRTFFRLFPAEWYLWLSADEACAWVRG